MLTLNPKYRYNNAERGATLADFGLLTAAKPVLSRANDLRRKREARRVARELREQQARLTITCANGFKIRPIK